LYGGCSDCLRLQGKESTRYLLLQMVRSQ
jgi:hypothetical protein